MDTAVLMDKMKKGDMSALGELAEMYQQPLYYYIVRMVRDRDTAEDLTQEVFLKVWRYRKNYRESGKLNAWIYRIAHNHTISILRKKNKSNQDISWDEHDLDQIVQSDFDIEKSIFQKIDYHNLLKNIDLLPLKYKEVLLLKYIEGKDYQEISDIIRKPIGTVGTLINRAKNKLLQEIENSQGGLKK